jgi:tetratricopeptide (TPR) repeat protein
MTAEPPTVEAAIAAYRSGDANGAIRALSDRLAVRPNDGDAWHALGVIGLQSGDAELAIRALRRAAAAAPLDPAPYEDLSAAYAASGMPELAFDCRQSAGALASTPDDLAKAVGAGQHYDVLKEGARRIAAGDRDVRIHYHMAVARQAFNEVAGVIDHLHVVTRQVPAFAAAFTALGDYLRQAWRLAGMASDFRRSTTGRADAETPQRLLDEAEACYRHALVLDPDDAQTHSALGNLLLDAGRVDEAVTHHQSAAVAAKEDAIVHFNLAIGLERQGRFAEALAAAARTTALRPDFGEAHECRGRCLAAAGRHLEAAACFERALDCAPTMSTQACF